MRGAGVVFVVAGLAYFAWGIGLALYNGIRINDLLMAVFAATFVYLGLRLIQGNKAARLPGLVSAVVVSFLATYMASWFVFPGFPETLFTIPIQVLPLFCSLVACAIA